METVVLEQRNFNDIKNNLDKHANLLKLMLQEDSSERMTKEWRKMVRRLMAIVRYESDAMDEWYQLRGIDSAREALASRVQKRG